MQKAAQVQGTSTDDRLYAFEAAGQLLGTEDLAASEQETAVRGLLQPLQHQIDEQLAHPLARPPQVNACQEDSHIISLTRAA